MRVTSGESPSGALEQSAWDATTAPNLTPPPGNPRFPLFDSLRAIAALSVFAGHTVTGVYSLTVHHSLFVLAAHVAAEGVAIFFLISGFLLYRPFLVARRGGRPVSLTGYARRRVLRIIPAYWVALSIFLLLGMVSGITAANWWVFYGFGQNYSFSTIGSGIGVAWTLCIEVTFYLALPLFAALAARLSPPRWPLAADLVLLVLLSAASLAYRAHFSSFFDLNTVSTLPGTFMWFALGMGLAVASVTPGCLSAMGALGAKLRHWPLLSWAVALGLFIAAHEVALDTSYATSEVVTHPLYGLAAFFLLLPAVFPDGRGDPVRGLLRWPPLAWIGLISYAFYLYHTIVIAQLDKLALSHGWPARYVLVALLAFFLSLTCAAASFYIVERPLMRLGARGVRAPR